MANLGSLFDNRLSKLDELHRLFTDPLLEQPFDKDKEQDELTKSYFAANFIEIDKDFDVKSLVPKGENDTFASQLNQNIEKSIFHPIATGVKRKLEADSIEEKTKSRKVFKPNNRITRPTSTFTTKPAKPSAVKSIKTQEEVTQEEIDSFLQRDISELEILSIPEHYPTKPHSVSSLAELYYLTQTLPLIKLLLGSHKVLMTDNFELALLEGKIAVLYSRIEELKRQGKWSLRQPQRFYDPFTYAKKTKKYTFHWDNLLHEARWMSEDFKEGSKFKKACCVIMAQAVKDYWVHGKAVCIKRKPIVHLPEEPEVNEEVNKEESTEENDMEADKKTEEIAVSDVGANIKAPDTEAIDVSLLTKDSTNDPAPTEETPIIFGQTVNACDAGNSNEREDRSPFKLHIDINNMKRIDQSIIKNLPKFSVFNDSSQLGSTPALKPKDSPLVPVSRLLHPFDDDDDWFKIVVKEASNNNKSKTSKSSGPPEYQKGLFGFQSHRRFNYLKPPKPPLIKNIEYRSPTIWLPQDDKYLIHYVAEFCFNWELISEHLSASASSLKRYESNIERRTPWQCFERYIQLNEKFQFSDMKGVYSYHAQQWLEHAHKAQSTTKRRISPLGVGAESIQRGHRRLRWASLFDAIRKCMKKREISATKINNRRTTGDSSNTGAVPGQTTVSNFNATGTKRVVDRVPTPAELSKLKFERDKTIQEAYLNQQATRSRMMAAVAQQQKQQLTGQRTPSQSASANNNIGPQQRVPIDNKASSSSTPQSQQSTQSLQQRQRPNNMPDPNKRPTTPNGTPYTPAQVQQLLQIQKQRRLMQQQNQQNQQAKGSTSQVSSPSMMQNMALNKPVGNASPPPNQPLKQTPNASLPQAQSSSSQSQNGGATKSRIHFAPAQVSAIINSIQQKNPGFSKEQVTKLAAQYLANLQQQQQERYNQQQQQRAGQPVASGSNQFRPSSSQPHKQPQIATLTPQERNQLQMLKAAKTAQQQQLQQQQHQQLNPNQNFQRKGSPNGESIDVNSMSKLEYEQRKRAMIQKQQQQQRISGVNMSPLSGSATPRMPSSSSPLPGSPHNRSNQQN